MAAVVVSMLYRLLCALLRLLVRLGVEERDFEIVVLRHQLKILRRGGIRPRFTTADRAFLAAASRLLGRERWTSFLVAPDTLNRWHRQLLSGRRRPRSRRPGRPPLDPGIKELVLRLGRENPRWGYLRIRGELLKLGVDLSGTTIAAVLRQGGLGPAPRRIGPTWVQFLKLQAYAVLSGENHDFEEPVGPEGAAPASIAEPGDDLGDDDHESADDRLRSPDLRLLGAAAPRLTKSTVGAASGVWQHARDGPLAA